MAKRQRSGIKPESDYPELLPPEGDERLGYKVFTILDEILKDKNDLGLPGKWNRHYELGKNKHWKIGTKKASLVSANLLFTHRQRTVNMLTDNNPTFNVARIGDYDDEVFETLLRTADFWWRDQEQQHILEESINQAETKGCVIEKSVFNPDLEFGLGEAETETVDPFHFGFYPVKAKKLQKADGCFHFWPMSVREAKRRWPKYKKDITGDVEFLKDLGDQQRDVIGGKPGVPKGYFSTFGGIIKNMLNVAGEGKGESDELLIVEAWIKDYTILREQVLQIINPENPEEPIQLPVDSPEAMAIIDSNEIDYEITTTEQPKYKGFIRVVTTCNGGKVVLSDRSNPSINPNLPDEEAQKTYLYDKYPFSLTPSVTDPNNPWGMSDFEQLEGLQTEINKAISQFTLVKDKVARLKFINPATSGIPNSKLTNYPGILNPKNSLEAAALGYVKPPQMPIDLLKAVDLYKEFFFLVAGTFEIEAAQAPGRDVIAYKAIAALLERAATMQRGKLRNYCGLIRIRGRMYLSHVMNWYTEDRWINYEEDGKEISQKIRGNELIIPAKLNVVSGSTMPVSKVQEREEALGLFEKGAIDVQELLKRLEWPNWKQVIERMQAGPLGEYLQKLQMLGIPQELMGLFQQLSQIEADDVQKAVEDGEIPTFPQIIQQMMKEQEQQPQLPSPEEMEVRDKDASIRVKDANIQKEQAEIALIQEKILTERVDQQVKMKGIEFDEEKLKIERARVVEEMQNDVRKDGIERAKITASAKQKGTAPYKEKGLKSNNKEV